MRVQLASATVGHKGPNMTKLKTIGNFSHTVLAILIVASLILVGVAGASPTLTIKGEVIELRAMKFIADHIPWDPDTTEITIDYKGQDIVVPAGIVDMKFSLPSRRVRLGRFPVIAKIKVGNIFQKKLRLTAHVTHYAPVVKTLRPVNRGKILTARDVVVEIVLSNRIVRNAMTRLDDVVGNQAIRNMGMGRVVTVNSLRKPALVNKGDQVILLAESGSMKITAPGIAREKGFKNSLVQVLNIQTKKTVFGIVIDSKTVKVNF